MKCAWEAMFRGGKRDKGNFTTSSAELKLDFIVSLV
jgi:hypothetical protein